MSPPFAAPLILTLAAALSAWVHADEIPLATQPTPATDSPALTARPSVLTGPQLAPLQAQAFGEIYASTCIQHLTQLETLRDKLQTIPKLPAEQAQGFLAGRAGDAWAVPNPHGQFVLALPAQTPGCAVYAQRADTAAARQQFDDLVAHAPTPLKARKVSDQDTPNPRHGVTRTVVYEWAAEGSPRKMVFTLSTAASPSAPLQAVATAVMVSQPSR